MKRSGLNKTIAFCMAGALLVSPLGQVNANAATANIEKLKVPASTQHQWLKEDLKLTAKLSGQEITYSVGDANPNYVYVDGNVLKINRPKVGEGNYHFTLTASITQDGETQTKDFPMIIAAEPGDDDLAGYLYVCFMCPNNVDVQQVHFFLSEDGLNWTAVNGAQPLFLTGKDYINYIEKAGPKSVNYKIKDGVDISETTTGDASVLFPFEGKDQGIRDPYLIKGELKDGSDNGKYWILATDLNTHSKNYGAESNLANNVVGNWGRCADSNYASQSLFVYETDDFVNWTRRWIDVGTEVHSDMAWAPEAIYNPAKDNYLVYWSSRTDDDGSSRDRLYCNETYDFKEFGPTMLYENEPFYEKYGASGKGSNSGYGNIDTSMIWVGGEDENGNWTDYKTLYRVVKDETNNHEEMQYSTTVFDPSIEWTHVVKDAESGEWVEVTQKADGTWADAAGKVRDGRVWDYYDPKVITPYELDGKTYEELSDLSNIPNNTNDIKRAEIVYNWYKNSSVGDHFTGIEQDVLQFGGTGTTTYHEGPTMFKFIDRDEWCVMIDNYGNMSIRYEPYTTTDLSQPNSVSKVADGYGRTGGDVGCHGGMIPITTKQYNTIIDAYNSDPSVTNYHPIAKIASKTEIEGTVARLSELAENVLMTDAQRLRYSTILGSANRILADAKSDNSRMANFVKYAEGTMKVTMKADTDSVNLAVGGSQKVEVTTTPSYKLQWYSVDTSVAKVTPDGTITAVGKGSTFVYAKAGDKGIQTIKVTVK
ncbi:MAG: hypothetical protein E7294_01470 [Lachnospiraceae bacterium]|jgi:hypothetical protein|nr:hypothetical protein [Lachnospiraceae bacterium]